MNLRRREGQRLNYTHMSTFISFCMFKSFITFYLVQYHKNAFHNKLVRPVSLRLSVSYGPHFLYSDGNLLIQSEYKKIRTKKSSVFGQFSCSVYSILKVMLHFLVLVKNHSQISALDWLESVTNKT